MEEWIGTLPITPNKNARLGFYLAPLLVDALGKLTGKRGIILVNQLGRKKDEESFKGFIETTRRLKIDLPVYRDDDKRHIQKAFSTIEKFLEEGLITEETANILVCPCGIVELTEEAVSSLVNTRTMAKTFKIEEGKIICRSCGKEIRFVGKNKILLFRPKIEKTIPRVKIFPRVFFDEFAEKYSELQRRPWVISRIREASPSFSLPLSSFRIDVDFLWALLPKTLMDEGKHISAFVVGHRSLRQMAMVLSLAEMTEVLIKEITVVPYLKIIPSANSPSFQDRAESITANYDAALCRVLLGMGLSKTKEMALSSEAIYWIDHSIRRVAGMPLDEMLQEGGIKALLFSGAAREMISYLRKKKAGFEISNRRIVQIAMKAFL